ncbi:MAG: GNAT family N-acetyltransferase [Candidatus Dormibacteraeota bacterium]|nr:GNAT family N-acetyltransferase [Candidatus Dormibacteraeota bacterium]
MTSPAIRRARFDELPSRTLYGILKLRSDIFVVEQECVFSDMDGRDMEPGTEHLWMENDDAAVIAALRILDEGGGLHHIGRVVTRIDHRRQGLSEQLMRASIDLVGPPVEVKAQSRLESWYARLGFVRQGGDWIQDGIAHVLMRLS